VSTALNVELGQTQILVSLWG